MKKDSAQKRRAQAARQSAPPLLSMGDPPGATTHPLTGVLSRRLEAFYDAQVRESSSALLAARVDESLRAFRAEALKFKQDRTAGSGISPRVALRMWKANASLLKSIAVATAAQNPVGRVRIDFPVEMAGFLANVLEDLVLTRAVPEWIEPLLKKGSGRRKSGSGHRWCKSVAVLYADACADPCLKSHLDDGAPWRTIASKFGIAPKMEAGEGHTTSKRWRKESDPFIRNPAEFEPHRPAEERARLLVSILNRAAGTWKNLNK